MIPDHIGRLAGSQHRSAPDGRLREVVIVAPDEPGGVIRLLTGLLQVSAWVIGLLDRYRWQVELFVRWLKATVGFRHPLSERREAIAFAVSVAVVGTMLLALRWDARPSKYALALLHQVSGGGATVEEIIPIPAERERRCARDRESQRRRQEKVEAKRA